MKTLQIVAWVELSVCWIVWSLAFVKPVGSSRVDLQACKLEYSIVSPK